MATARGWVSPSVLPGFGLTLGFAGLFLTFIVLIPMAALIMRAGSLPRFMHVRIDPPLSSPGAGRGPRVLDRQSELLETTSAPGGRA